MSQDRLPLAHSATATTRILRIADFLAGLQEGRRGPNEFESQLGFPSLIAIGMAFSASRPMRATTGIQISTCRVRRQPER